MNFEGSVWGNGAAEEARTVTHESKGKPDLWLHVERRLDEANLKQILTRQREAMVKTSQLKGEIIMMRV